MPEPWCRERRASRGDWRLSPQFRHRSIRLTFKFFWRNVLERGTQLIDAVEKFVSSPIEPGQHLEVRGRNQGAEGLFTALDNDPRSSARYGFYERLEIAFNVRYLNFHNRLTGCCQAGSFRSNARIDERYREGVGYCRSFSPRNHPSCPYSGSGWE